MSASGRWTKEPLGEDPRRLEGEAFAATVEAGTVSAGDRDAQAAVEQTDPGGYPHESAEGVSLTPSERRLRELAEEGEREQQDVDEAETGHPS